MSEKLQSILSFAKEKGVIRPRDLKSLGVSPQYIYHLVASGVMVRSGRGLYMLSDYEATENHSLVEAVRIQSNGVICLLSALSFHEIGTQLPHQVWVAVPYGSRIVKSNTTPIRSVVMRSPSYGEGIERHLLEGTEVAIYGIAKTIADTFKFRNRVGLDVALEALRDVLRNKRCTREEIRNYAKINRVEKVMQPYMESMT